VAAGLSSAFTGMTVEEPPDSPTEGGGVLDSSGGIGEGSDDASPTEKESSSKSSLPTEQPNITHDTYPECWFEDVESGIPLRWHLFAGVLYDLMKGKSMFNCSSWKGATNEPMQHNFLPWRIRLHFTSYPSDHLLPFGDGCTQSKLESSKGNDAHSSRVNTILRRIFRNSLKQALFMQYGSSKVAMAMTKHTHETIWDAVLQSNYGNYHAVNVELQSGISSPSIGTRTYNNPTTADDDQGDIPQLIPVRLMLNGMPAIQKPTKHEKDCKFDRKRPTEILEQLGKCQALPYTTLGDVLANYLPDYFAIDPSTGWVTAVSDANLSYYIQGVQPSMKCAVVDLWRALSHPDHFLYVIVVTE